MVICQLEVTPPARLWLARAAIRADSGCRPTKIFSCSAMMSWRLAEGPGCGLGTVMLLWPGAVVGTWRRWWLTERSVYECGPAADKTQGSVIPATAGNRLLA